MASVPTAVVTGAAGGLGERACLVLAAAGYDVVACDRQLPQLPGCRCMRVDVRVHADVAALAEAVGARCAVIVHAAGVAYFRAQEEAEAAAVAELFDVNVLGAVRVNQALLAAVREARGTVVFVSSIAGRVTFAESGFYAASKHAVEALAEALAEEAGALGVKVRVLQPGAFATGFQDAAAAFSGSPPQGSPYAEQRPLWTSRREAVLASPQEPARFAEALAAALKSPHRFERLPVGRDAEALPVERTTALDRLLD